MASTVTLVNVTSQVSGVQSPETGINIRSFKTVVEPEFIKLAYNIDGSVKGKAVGPMKKTVTMEGEYSGATGVMAAVATASFTPANSSAYFGAPTTGLYLLKGEVTEARDDGAWRDVNCEFDCHLGIP